MACVPEASEASLETEGTLGSDAYLEEAGHGEGAGPLWEHQPWFLPDVFLLPGGLVDHEVNSTPSPPCTRAHRVM